MTKLTNAFSKRWENLKTAYALWFASDNFCRVHSTLRVMLAVEAEITGYVWPISKLMASF